MLLDTCDVEVAKGTGNAVFWGNRNFTEFGLMARSHISSCRQTVVSFCHRGHPLREGPRPICATAGAK